MHITLNLIFYIFPKLYSAGIKPHAGLFSRIARID